MGEYPKKYLTTTHEEKEIYEDHENGGRKFVRTEQANA